MTRIVADWLSAPGTRSVCALLEDAGHQAWLVGGCVRNALLRAPVSDLDISTDAVPERVMALAKEAGIKAIPTGIDHGTVTLVVEGQPFEVTTFRRDVETDGRRAVVAFAETLEEDARRRDFTMNALYADGRGNVRDPVGGLVDLEQRRFRFIGDAELRIREDYLRILRFFRFFAWYGADLDADGLSACAALADGLKLLSAERVTAEMLKLLSAPDPLRAVAAMEQAGVLGHVVPGGTARVLGPYLQMAEATSPVARMVALGGDVSSLKLSRAEARGHESLKFAMESAAGAGELGLELGAEDARHVLALRAAALEQPVAQAHLDAAERGAQAVFPVAAKDLPDDLQGQAIGAALKKLRADWIASHFTLGKEELLARL